MFLNKHILNKPVFIFYSEVDKPIGKQVNLKNFAVQYDNHKLKHKTLSKKKIFQF